MSISTNDINYFVNHLDEDGLRQMVVSLLLHSETKKFIEGCIVEWNKFYRWPKKPEDKKGEIKRYME